MTVLVVALRGFGVSITCRGDVAREASLEVFTLSRKRSGAGSRMFWSRDGFCDHESGC